MSDTTQHNPFDAQGDYVVRVRLSEETARQLEAAAHVRGWTPERYMVHALERRLADLPDEDLDLEALDAAKPS